jgi:hypothetical protein
MYFSVGMVRSGKPGNYLIDSSLVGDAYKKNIIFAHIILYRVPDYLQSLSIHKINTRDGDCIASDHIIPKRLPAFLP